MFLGVVPTVVKWTPDGKECSLLLEENPLTAFVELPEGHAGLLYSNLLCGVLRGALEMVRSRGRGVGWRTVATGRPPLPSSRRRPVQVQMKVDVSFVKDALRGDETTEIRMRLVESLADEAPPSDE